MQRFDCQCNEEYEHFHPMIKSPDGDYVLYAEALADKEAAVKDQCQRASKILYTKIKKQKEQIAALEEKLVQIETSASKEITALKNAHLANLEDKSGQIRYWQDKYDRQKELADAYYDENFKLKAENKLKKIRRYSP